MHYLVLSVSVCLSPRIEKLSNAAVQLIVSIKFEPLIQGERLIVKPAASNQLRILLSFF
jgi:hypothetical protein